MRTRHFVISLSLALAFLTWFTQPVVSQEKKQLQWYTVDNNKVTVHMFLFWSQSCNKCAEARPFIDSLRKNYSWLKIHEYEINTNPENRDLYQRFAQSLKQQAGQVPAFFFLGKMQIGYDSYQTTGKYITHTLERGQAYLQKQVDDRNKKSESSEQTSFRDVELLPVLTAYLIALQIEVPPPIDFGPTEDEQKQPKVKGKGEEAMPPMDLELPNFDDEESQKQASMIEIPFLGIINAQDYSLPAMTFVIAGADAFNPCAFFVLLSLLSVLIHTNSRPRMLFVGGIFVLFSGLFYFVFMAAWLNLFFLLGNLPFITITAGTIAILVAFLNMKDYFWFKQGPSLSIPKSAKPGLFQRMRDLINASSIWSLIIGAVTLAVAANTYELLCTSGFPMVFTRTLTLQSLSTAEYYGYLALYNIIYVLPLLIIVLGFTYSLGRRKLQEHEGRILKLLSGLMMLLLGLTLVIKPGWLESLYAAVGILALSIFLTAAIVFVERVWQNKSATVS